jgi:hypothetical protein
MIDAGGVLRRFKAFCTDELGWPEQATTNDGVDLIDAGLVDSLAVLEIVDFLGAHGVHIPGDELTPDNFASFDAIGELVVRIATTASPRKGSV